MKTSRNGRLIRSRTLVAMLLFSGIAFGKLGVDLLSLKDAVNFPGGIEIADTVCELLACIKLLPEEKKKQLDNEKCGFIFVGGDQESKNCFPDVDATSRTFPDGSVVLLTKDLFHENRYLAKAIVFEEMFHTTQRIPVKPTKTGAGEYDAIESLLYLGERMCREMEAQVAGYVNLAHTEGGASSGLDESGEPSVADTLDRFEAELHLKAYYKQNMTTLCKVLDPFEEGDQLAPQQASRLDSLIFCKWWLNNLSLVIFK